jgi:hypothetical protein
MADKKVTELTAIASVSSDDLLLVVNDPTGTPASRKITLKNFFGTVAANTVHTGTVTLNGGTTVAGTMSVSANTTFTGNLKLTSDTPASNNALVEGYGVGSIWYDSDYIYVATASGQIKRAALSVF